MGTEVATRTIHSTVIHRCRAPRSVCRPGACSTARMTQPSRNDHWPRQPAVVVLGSDRPLEAAIRPTGTIDATAARLAKTQHGQGTRRQLQVLGISSRAIHRRVAAGAWTARAGGVVDLGSHQRSWEQDLTASMLAAGGDLGQAWASHRTAGHLHGLLDLEAPPHHEITVPRHRRPDVPGVRLHRVRSLPTDERLIVAGFPATSVARTLLDLASSIAPAQLEPILWDAARGAGDLAVEIARLLERYPARHGRPTLSRLLADMHPQIAAAESPLEVYGLLALRDPLLPDPVLQYRVRDRLGRIVARLDAAWPEHRSGLEFDGARYHGSPSRRARDADRRHGLRELGWDVVVVTAQDLAGSRLRTLKAELRRRLGVG